MKSQFKNTISTVVQQLKILTKDHSVLVKGSGQSFIIKTLSLALGFGLHILLARILKLNDYGIYMYVLTWINVLTLAGKFGLDQAGKKFIPAYQSQNKKGKLYSFYRYSFSRVFGISTLLSIGIILTTYLLKTDLGAPLFYTFISGAILLSINTLLSLTGSFLEALKKIISGLFPREILRPTLIMLGIALLFFFDNPTSNSAMIVNIIATGISLAMILFFFIQAIPKQTNIYTPDKIWIKTALPLLLTSGIHLLLTQTDIILIGYFLDTNAVGIYSSVSKISHLVLFGLTAVNTITAPLISELFSKNNLKKLQEMISFSALLTLFLTLPLILVIALLSSFILSLFGTEFIAGTTALYIILAGQIINAFSGSVSFLMTMTKFHTQSLYILAIAALINLIMNVILIPSFGIEGAAFTTAITTVFWNLAMYFYIKNKLKIDSSILGLF